MAALITREKVAEMIQLIHESLVRAGIAAPRVDVCGLNPHNGDGGAYGREEIDIITPGVELARSRGFAADGPYPADTMFVRCPSPRRRTARHTTSPAAAWRTRRDEERVRARLRDGRAGHRGRLVPPRILASA